MKKLLALVLLLSSLVFAADEKTKPHVVVVGVNGGELDFILPLVMQGKMPNLKSLMDRGVYGHLRTIPFAICPKVYSTISTSATPEEHGITFFDKPVSDIQRKPLWEVLNENNITTGYANVPATWPAPVVKGYVVSGMDTPSKTGTMLKPCNGELCPVKLSEADRPVYPLSLKKEILDKVGNITLDCEELPDNIGDRLTSPNFVATWLQRVKATRQAQSKLFGYLLENHPTDFVFYAQSCEDRVGHWLYPIHSWNAGYRPAVQGKYPTAFVDQYLQFDVVLGEILKHTDAGTTVIVLSDHGIKPLHEMHDHDEHIHGTKYVVAHHAFSDGDDVPGMIVAAGPGIKKGVQIKGLEMSVYDVAPTVLRIYGIRMPVGYEGRVLQEIFAR